MSSTVQVIACFFLQENSILLFSLDIQWCMWSFVILVLILIYIVLFCFYKFKQVKVSTVLGSNGPPLTVKLVRASSSGSKDSSVIESQVSFYCSLFSCYFFQLYFSDFVAIIWSGELLWTECVPICVIQELKFDKESASHSLDLSKNVDVGRYVFVFEVTLSVHLFVLK